MASDPKIIGFLQHIVMNIEADTSELTFEAKVGLDLLASVIDWHGGNVMVSKLIESPM